MSKKVLVLEDEEMSRRGLASIVRKCNEEIQVYECATVEEAQVCMLKEDIDLFFIDIILNPNVKNDHSGIDFAEKIRTYDKYCAVDIVFVTVLAGLEAELLKKIHCYDYIEKPIKVERVQRVVRDAFKKVDHYHAQDEICFEKENGVLHGLHANKIIYVESHRKMLHVYLENGIAMFSNVSMKKFISQIKTQRFLIPTKGVAVNYNYIEYVDVANRYVKMVGEDKLLKIGHRMRKPFLKELDMIQNR